MLKIFNSLRDYLRKIKKEDKDINCYIKNNNIINPLLEALKITVIYGIVGQSWVWLSDKFILAISDDIEVYKKIQTYKGGIYVLATMLLIFLLTFNKIILLKKALEEIAKNNNELNAKNREITIMHDELKYQFNELEKYKNAHIISEQRLELAIDGSDTGIWDWDLENNTFYFSTKWKSHLGYEDNEIDNTYEAWINLFHPDEREDATLKISSYTLSKMGSYENVNRMRCIDGSYIWILCKAKAIRDVDGKVIRITGSLTDITEEKLLENKLNLLAYYDKLTELPNRFLFEEKVNKLMSELANSSKKFALLYLDIDNFKNINDALGHYSGDLLIKYIGNILKYQVGVPDFVARLGGDEFAVIFYDVRDREDIVSKTQNLMKFLRRPWIFDKQEFFVSVSIGIAIYPEHGEDLKILLRNADIAMYFVKKNMKDNYCFYTIDMQDKSLEYTRMVNYIRHAINYNEFHLMYQPIISLNDGKLVGAEVLIRWNHPELGAVPPMEFIPLAEETGLIFDIEKWILKTALMQKKEWIEKNYPNIKISINISGKRFVSAGIINEIRDLLCQTGIKSDEIQLEVTETAVMKDLDSSMKILNEIKDLGIQIALDDFGTGYSSLTYLKKLPIDVVKLDREFIKNILKENNDSLIVEYIIKLIHELNLKIVAEGIESENQLVFLKSNNCDYGQGYLFAKPIPKEDFEKFMLSIDTF